MSEGNGNGFAGASALFAKKDTPREIVEIDGDRFLLQGLTESQRERELETWLNDSKGRPRPERAKLLRPRLIQLCLVDGAGERVISDDQLLSIRDLPAYVVGKLCTAALKVCGMSDDDISSLEDAEKNSPAARG